MTTTNLTLSPEIMAVATLVAAKQGLAVDRYIESLVREHAIPQFAAALGIPHDWRDIPVEPAGRVASEILRSEELSSNTATKEPTPKKKKRRKSKKSWECPCCLKRSYPMGNKLHFLSCATRAGLSVREIAAFCHGDHALARMYGATRLSSIDEIESGIRALATNVRFTHRLIENGAKDAGARRSRLTAKTRMTR